MRSGCKIKRPVTKGYTKVPVIMQMEALECGAACLAMILAYYERWVPLEQLRLECGVSRDGSNAKNMLKVARFYGLTAQAYRYEPKSLKEKGKFPCIIHWNFNHFVVLNGFKGDKAVLNDPAKGNYMVPMEVFDESFTGVCLFFEPGDDFEPGGKPKSILKFAKERLSGAGPAIAFTVFIAIISSLVGIIQPIFSRIFMDRLLTGKNPEWLYPFIWALTLLVLVQIIVGTIQAIYTYKINGKFAVVGSTTYFWKVLQLPMEFFSQRMAGDILGRQGNNASIANALVNIFAPMALNTLMMLFYLTVMLRYNWKLTMIGLCSICINLWMSHIISEKRLNISRVQMRDKSKLGSMTVAGIEMIETIKASGSEDGFFEKWAGYQASVNTQNVKYIKLNQYLGMIPTFVSSLTNLFVLISGVYLVIKGEFTVGMLMAFQGFLSSFMSPVQSLISAGQSLQEMRVQMDRIEDVMKYPADPMLTREVEESSEYHKLSGNLEMRDVTFGYSKLAEPLIKDFNLKIKQGERIAFVGTSGCGKSTLAKLLSGLYQPWTGDILFDGKKMTEIDRNVFTGSLAVVDQDIILFEDTISNNIKMWNNSIEDYEVIMSAFDAKLHKEILQREGGYDYKITENGKDFSGGQRQRIEIARALVGDPTILIMDEATSALDAKTEYEVVEAIKARGITCIIVAHRLSTIRDCDQIIVLDHGRIAEQGNHEELMALGGLYKELMMNE